MENGRLSGICLSQRIPALVCLRVSGPRIRRVEENAATEPRGGTRQALLRREAVPERMVDENPPVHVPDRFHPGNHPETPPPRRKEAPGPALAGRLRRHEGQGTRLGPAPQTLRRQPAGRALCPPPGGTGIGRYPVGTPEHGNRPEQGGRSKDTGTGLQRQDREPAVSVCLPPARRALRRRRLHLPGNGKGGERIAPAMYADGCPVCRRADLPCTDGRDSGNDSPPGRPV